MLYPATYNITILQNATWKALFRAIQDGRSISSIVITDGIPSFTSADHKLEEGDKVVFTGEGEYLPELERNVVYYVISSGLTSDAFCVSSALGGSSIQAISTPAGTIQVADNGLQASNPINLSGYIIDSDIKAVATSSIISTFTATLTDAVNGQFELLMVPEVSVGIEAGSYIYDVSLTSPEGERYYWLTGTVTVARTISRN